MLVANAGQDPILWLCNIAQLFDLSTAPGAHFAYKYLMLIVEHLTNHTRNAHRRIIAAGRYQHIIFFLQDRSQHEFCAGLPITSRNTDADQVISTVYDSNGVLYKPSVDLLLRSLPQHSRQHNPLRQHAYWKR